MDNLYRIMLPDDCARVVRESQGTIEVLAESSVFFLGEIMELSDGQRMSFFDLPELPTEWLTSEEYLVWFTRVSGRHHAERLQQATACLHCKVSRL